MGWEWVGLRRDGDESFLALVSPDRAHAIAPVNLMLEQPPKRRFHAFIGKHRASHLQHDRSRQAPAISGGCVSHAFVVNAIRSHRLVLETEMLNSGVER